MMGLDISVYNLSPVVALIAGILVLLLPRLLSCVIACYLILVGLLGLLGR
jgi:hypothetical protein